MPSVYQDHVERWQRCRGCLLHVKRTSVVFSRGTIPCEILFLGEAPGESEDVVGIPFVGPAGKLLDKIIDQAYVEAGRKFTHCFYNLVGCIPRDESGGKSGEPTKASIKSCSMRLVEFLGICKPKVIVCVGKLAYKYLPEYGYAKVVEITHPAAILRSDITQRGLLIQRAIVQIANTIS